MSRRTRALLAMGLLVAAFGLARGLLRDDAPESRPADLADQAASSTGALSGATGRKPASVPRSTGEERRVAAEPARVPAQEELQSLVSPSWRAADPFINEPIVSFEESERGPQGQFTRSRVVRTDMKYPLILIEENFERGKDGQDRLAKRLAMVADHLLVTLKQGYTEGDLQREAASRGARVERRVSPDGRSYIVSFESTDVSALRQMIADFRSSPAISSPEPDFIVKR